MRSARSRKTLRRLAPLPILLIGVPASLLLWLLIRAAKYVPAARTLPAELRAARTAGLPLEPDDLYAGPPASPDENAAPIYRDIARMLAARRDDEGDRAIAGLLKRRPRTNADRRRARARLAALAPVLARAEQAAARPRCDFRRRLEEGLSLVLPEYAPCRKLVRAFAARAILKSEAGDAAGALRDVATGARIGRHMSEDPFVISLLVQEDCQSTADRVFTEVVLRHAGEPDLLRRAAEAEKAFAPRPDLRRAFRGEIVCGRILIQRLSRWNSDDTLIGPPIPKISIFERALRSDAWEARAVRFWRRAVAALEAHPNDLRAQQRALAELSRAEKASRGQPAYEASAILGPIFGEAALHAIRGEAQDRLRRTLLALVAHRRRTGRFPARLADLSPAPPADVFTGKPLVYRRTGAGFVLYSVGENGRDEGGRSRTGKGPDDIAVAGP